MIAGTGVILSSYYEVGKISNEAMNVVHRDLILVLESSSHNYYVSVADCACVT